MIPMNKTQSDALKCIKRWRKKYDSSPRIAEIAREIGKSYSSVYMALLKLEKYGYVELHREYRSIIIRLTGYE